MAPTRPLPTVIGPTENALRSLLARALSSTLIPGYPEWVVLNAIGAAGATDATDAKEDWRGAVEAGLKVDRNGLEAIVAQLHTAGLVGIDGTLTTVGSAELAAARAEVRGTTLRLVDGIDEAEQETTRRVLDTIRRNAEELLTT